MILAVNHDKEAGERIMSEKTIPYKIYLEEEEMPKQWYNCLLYTSDAADD